MFLDMNLDKKTDKVKALLRSSRFKEALAITKTFRFGFTKSEKRSIEIAHEVLTGNERFYQLLGIDTEKEIRNAHKILINNFL